MKIKDKKNTFYLMVGPSHSGKSTLARKIEKELILRNLSISRISKDDLRREILKKPNLHKYDPIMARASEKAKELLYERIKLAFKKKVDFLIIDSVSLYDNYILKMKKISNENGYYFKVILIDYSDKDLYYPDGENKMTDIHMKKFNKYKKIVEKIDHYKVKKRVNKINFELIE